MTDSQNNAAGGSNAAPADKKEEATEKKEVKENKESKETKDNKEGKPDFKTESKPTKGPGAAPKQGKVCSQTIDVWHGGS